MRILTLAILTSMAIVCAADDSWLTEGERNLIAQKNGMTREQFNKYAAYLHPRVTGPIPGGVSLTIPSDLGNRRLAEMGIVDVTAEPFRADPSGESDTTDAIREGIAFARDHQMVLFFPAGKYRISDTLECRQKLTARGNGRLVGAPRFPCVLVGSADPQQRSVFYLAPRSEGFTDPEKRKIVVHIVNCNYGSDKRNFELDPLRPQANISFNQIFCDIDIMIGEGNAGAIGIRMQAAEGSSIQNVTIDATHGHTGMQGAAGSGGSHHNITIKGGRIGIDTHGYPPEFSEQGTGTQPTPTMSHVTLIGQSEAALVNKSRGPLVGVGWEIRSTTKGPVIRTERDWRAAPYNGGLALIDSTVEFGNAGGTMIDARKSFYMRNVHVHRAGMIADGVPGDPQGWVKIEELAYPIQPEPFKQVAISEPVYLNGKRSTSHYAQVQNGDSPASSLRDQHIWGTSFPSWQSPAAVNIKDAPYGAVGDGTADDTDALQKAIDENEIVFLPKGYYRVTDTIRLRPDTKLVGVAHHLSTIMTRAPYGALAEGELPKPLVQTAESADADTVIAFVGIMLANEAPEEVVEKHDGILPFYALHWRSGGSSMVRSPQIARGHLYGFPRKRVPGFASFAYVHPAVRISGNGGGRWYNFFIHGLSSAAEDYRHLLVEGTNGPLRFYQLHAQHSDSAAQCEVRNSRNVSIYGVKTEYQTRFLIANNTQSLHIFGHGGNATAIRGSAHYLFTDCNDLLLSNMSDQIDFRQTTPRTIPYHKHPVQPWTKFAPFIVRENGKETVIPTTERPILWRSGF